MPSATESQQETITNNHLSGVGSRCFAKRGGGGKGKPAILEKRGRKKATGPQNNVF